MGTRKVVESRALIPDTALRRERLQQRRRRPTGPHDRNELVVLIRKLGVDVRRADRGWRMEPRFDSPRTIAFLAFKQEPQASPIRAINSREPTSFVQREECLTGRIRVAGD